MAAPTVCVYCRRQPVHPMRVPFCSERCRLLDLAAWASGEYRIPGPPLPDRAPEALAPPDGDEG
jgi:endogenous inhibitor of DNA gyrase (YacG/DUF329 family)